MQIRDIFKKPISRPINGVVKADQVNESVVWQELEEYVVTRELNRYLKDFVSAYLAALDQPHDPVVASRMGVWVSGFFGSGKSHFIKILSYLLENRTARCPDTQEEKKAVDFFADKIRDPMLFADIKRMAGIDADVVLFNIDSRADATEGRSVILSAFWRLFNESQGFCADSLHLAEMERYLTLQGRYDAFRDQFRQIYGSDWETERDAYSLLQDEIVQALSLVLDKSPEAAREWFEKYESRFSLTVDHFAKKVKAYLDTKPGHHRIIFLVDEIGQFIGNDTHLMLNLQTIVEDLGRICNGQAWVIVTSQEDIDAVIRDVRSSRANDFSKIQGRFNTRLSLSSTNTDEVIQVRLLEKQPHAQTALDGLFREKGDILKNQLSFSHDTATLKNYATAESFVNYYPFIPYHFQLVQKIFESIRKAGATGLHLSRGERSMLDAFQSAAVHVSDKDISALVPLYEFFPCIESFLDTAVKRSIDQAKDNKGLVLPMDIQLLQTLFLIRYGDILKPNIDNLVTLCIDQVDADRITLKNAIDASLIRLEKENLISRNGDLYFFLTNEEREVSREIRNITIPSHAETDLLAAMVFEDVLKNKNRHKYVPFKRDYGFNRICDDKPWGKKMDADLSLEIISPLHDQYDMFNTGKCNMHSLDHEGMVLVKLGNDPDLFSAIRTYIQTDTYIREKSDAAASTRLKQILRDRADDNRNRRDRLVARVSDLLQKADFHTLGKSLDIDAASPGKAVDEAFDYLVENTFRKFHYLTKILEDPVKEIRQILLADDIGQEQMVLAFDQEDPRDIREVMTYIDLTRAGNKVVVLDQLVRHFAGRPYGWPEFQVVILTATLFMAGKISLLEAKTTLRPKDAIPLLSKAHQWKQVQIEPRATPPVKDLQQARELGKELFGVMAPDGQRQIGRYIRTGLAEWTAPLDKYKPLADTGNYPGRQQIDDCLAVTTRILDIHDTVEMIRAFIDNKEDLLEAHDDLMELRDFYDHQKPTWESLTSALQRFVPNQTALEKQADVRAALMRLQEIADTPHPYPMLKEVSGLIATVDTANQAIVTEKRMDAVQEIEDKIQRITTLLTDHSAGDDFKNRVLHPLQHVKKKIGTEWSIPQISYSVNEFKEMYDTALETIEEQFRPRPEPDKPVKPTFTIKPADLKHKAFLDSEQDVARYIEIVQQALLKAIRNNQRIRIQ